MTVNVLLESYLRRLKLPTMGKNYAQLAMEAARSNVVHEEYLTMLAEMEVKVRDENAQKTRLRQACFPSLKAIDTFDFKEAPGVNKPLVLELLKGNYMDAAENVVLMGGVGVGKTHLAIALGVEACRTGRRAKFYSVAALINELIEAQEHRRLARLQQQLTKLDLLILDELGMVPYDKDGANMLFQIIASRNELKSTIVTTNLEFKDWTQVFGSQQLTTAVLDRLTHRCHILEMNGESFRFKQSLRKKKSKNS